MRPAPLLAAVLALPALLHAETAPTPAANTSTTDIAAIRNFYRTGLERSGVVGSTLILFDRGEIVLDEPCGKQSLTPPQPVDEHTTYHWASVTKTLTGVAIMQLRDRGLLSLDDPLTKYIPELNAVHDPFGPVSAITIRQAMSHSSGFRDATWPWRTEEWQPFEPTQWSQIVAMLPYTSVDFAPGTRYRYSNLAVVFLGEIIERLSADTFEVYMQKNVLGPLGMTHSYYDRSPASLLPFRSHSWDRKDGRLTEDLYDFDTGITRATGGLNAPVSDMLLYLRFLLREPKARPRRSRPTTSAFSSATRSWRCGALSCPFRRTKTSPPGPAPKTRWPPASSSTPTVAFGWSAIPGGRTASAASSTSILSAIAGTWLSTTPTRRTHHRTLAASTSTCATT
jgi:CubicO group peptidase (beta-lactamase class C family)